MTFLAPTTLFLLAFIGIPVLIHLLNRFKVEKVKYSSIFSLRAWKIVPFGVLNFES